VFNWLSVAVGGCAVVGWQDPIALFLTILEFLVLRCWGPGGEQGFAGIAVARVVQLPFLLLQPQEQRCLLVWGALHLTPYL